jgi:hypothetical protein
VKFFFLPVQFSIFDFFLNQCNIFSKIQTIYRHLTKFSVDGFFDFFLDHPHYLRHGPCQSFYLDELFLVGLAWRLVGYAGG